MAPPQHPQRFGAPNNNLPPHYQQQQYTPHSQSGLPPPSLGGANPGFMNMNPISGNNPFSMNGNALSISGGFGGSGLGMAGGTGLASQAAQMGFAAAGQHNGMGEPGSRGAKPPRIRDVWKHNLEEEMTLLRQLVDRYPYIAMDTEFPGIVARPMGNFLSSSDYHYQTLRLNVDMLKIIQLGITLFTEDGETPPATEELPQSQGSRKLGLVQIPHTWQFNFEFSMENDMYSEPSIETLRVAGVELQRLERDGIDPKKFAALLITSGLVMDDSVHWISFHGGYDFGYLTKLLFVNAMPENERQFDELMKKFFPTIYDIKFLMKRASKQHNMGQLTPSGPDTVDLLSKFDQKSSLESLIEILKIKRTGLAHTAGSDALSTGKVFFKIRERIFNGEIPEEHVGKVWGLGFPDHNPAHHTPQNYSQHHQDHHTAPNQNGNSYANGAPSTPDSRNHQAAPAGVSTPLSGNGASTTAQNGTSTTMGNFGAFNFASMPK